MIFFFYGTLIAGGGPPAIRAVHRRLHPLGRGELRGRLYAVPDRRGWYPALLAGEGRVQGVLYAAAGRFSSRDLAVLDRYEAFDPRRRRASWYLRLRRRARGTEGAGLIAPVCTAQVYLYNRPLPRGARRLASGDFHRWLNGRGLRPFAG